MSATYVRKVAVSPGKMTPGFRRSGHRRVFEGDAIERTCDFLRARVPRLKSVAEDAGVSPRRVYEEVERSRPLTSKVKRAAFAATSEASAGLRLVSEVSR